MFDITGTMFGRNVNLRSDNRTVAEQTAKALTQQHGVILRVWSGSTCLGVTDINANGTAIIRAA